MKNLIVAMSVACAAALLPACGKIDNPAPAAKAAAVQKSEKPAPPAAKPAAAQSGGVASNVNDFGDYATGATALKIKQRQEKALNKLAKQQQARGGQ